MTAPPRPPGPLDAPASSPADEVLAQRASLVRIVRMAFVVMMMTVTLLYVLNVGESKRQSGDTALGFDLAVGWHISLSAGVLMLLIVLAIDMLTPRKKIARISGVFFGLLVGLIATWAMNFIVDLLVAAYEINAPNLVGAIKVLIGICLCYLGMSVVLQTQDDFRLVIPYVEFAKQLRGPRPLILDTSALIDARVADLSATGIFAVPLVIPRFVIDELQQLADSGEKLKRARGRRGLDVIARLQRHPAIDLTIDDTPVPGKAVDQMLVELARSMPGGGAILTIDSGLNRVAAIQGVSVLNLNDVAGALKPTLVPGTRVSIALIRKGEQPGQAVGYLEDGTMVVAEHADHLLGGDDEVELEVSSALQTSAGRLIFAKLAEAAPAPSLDAAPTADIAKPVAAPPAPPTAAAPSTPPGSAPPPPPPPPPPPSPPAALEPDSARSISPGRPPSSRPGTARNPRR
ncbi:MAG: PIN/TRAM domain-containing protein [Phycisphaerales bacterium]